MENVYHRSFIDAIREKIPHKNALANTITDFLMIDKDAVYRRIRGEVQFTFAEMAVIARNLGISLDSLAEISTPHSKPAQMRLARYTNPTKDDYRMFEDFISFFNAIRDEPGTETAEASNILPTLFFAGCDYLSRFYIFKWNQATSLTSPQLFHEVEVPEKLRNLQINLYDNMKYVKTSHFLWDNLIFQYLVSDIKYCAGVRLIKKDAVQMLKKELLDLLDYIEHLTVRGKFDETDTDVFIYICDVNINTNYFYLKSKNVHYSLVRTFVLNSYASPDKEIFNETKSWIESLKKVSTMISISCTKQRTVFLDEQRKLVNSL